MTDNIIDENNNNIIRVDDEPVIISEDTTIRIIDNGTSDYIVEENDIVSIVSVAEQGPAGPPGASGGEDEVAYAKLIDAIDDDHMYIGEADPGALESDPVWRIKYVLFIGDDTSIRWANGAGLFDKTWTDRATYTYL